MSTAPHDASFRLQCRCSASNAPGARGRKSPHVLSPGGLVATTGSDHRRPGCFRLSRNHDGQRIYGPAVVQGPSAALPVPGLIVTAPVRRRSAKLALESRLLPDQSLWAAPDWPMNFQSASASTAWLAPQNWRRPKAAAGRRTYRSAASPTTGRRRASSTAPPPGWPRPGRSDSRPSHESDRQTPTASSTIAATPRRSRTDHTAARSPERRLLVRSVTASARRGRAPAQLGASATVAGGAQGDVEAGDRGRR